MSIVKHSYLGSRRPAPGKSGATAGVSRALAHLKYIQHRPGWDKSPSGRELFDEKRDWVGAKEIATSIKNIKGAKVVVHKFILSPEIQVHDQKEFTREIMEQIGKDKGLDLRWVATGHKNTDHEHVHVIVLGVDKYGRDVKFNKEDHKKLREYSERYLEREHPVEYYEYKKEEKEREDAREHALAVERGGRPILGVPLPWMHQKIVREQLEPYTKWEAKRNKDLREAADRKAVEAEAAKTAEAIPKVDSIEAIGQTWTKENTHQELRDLNQHLWDNIGDRIRPRDYKKLVGWIKGKELLERIERDNAPIKAGGGEWSRDSKLEDLKELDARLWENVHERISVEDYKKIVSWIKQKERELEKQKSEEAKREKQDKEKEQNKNDREQEANNEPTRDQDQGKRQAPKEDKEQKDEPEKQEVERDEDQFTYNGKRYDKNSSYKELSALSSRLRQDKRRWLPVDDYQKLRGWIERKDRERWSGYLERYIPKLNSELGRQERENLIFGGKWTDANLQDAMANPVISVFMKVAKISRFIVKLVPLTDLSDPLRTAHENYKEAKRDYEKKAKDPNRSKEERLEDNAKIEKVSEPIKQIEQAADDKEKRKKEKQRERDMEDPFVFDPWGMQ